VTHLIPGALPHGITHAVLVDALQADICNGMSPPLCSVIWAGQNVRRHLQSGSYTVNQIIQVNSSVTLGLLSINSTNVASLLNVSAAELNVDVGASTAEIAVTLVGQGLSASAEASQALSTQAMMPNALASALGVSSSQIIVVSLPNLIAPPNPPPTLPHPSTSPPSSVDPSPPLLLPWPPPSTMPLPLLLPSPTAPLPTEQILEAAASGDFLAGMMVGASAALFITACMAFAWYSRRCGVEKNSSIAGPLGSHVHSCASHDATASHGAVLDALATSSACARGAGTELPADGARGTGNELPADAQKSWTSMHLPQPNALPEPEPKSLAEQSASEQSVISMDSAGRLVTGKNKKTNKRRSHLDLGEDSGSSPACCQPQRRRGSVEACATVNGRRRGSVEAPARLASHRRGSVERPPTLTGKASGHLSATALGASYSVPSVASAVTTPINLSGAADSEAAVETAETVSHGLQAACSATGSSNVCTALDA